MKTPIQALTEAVNFANGQKPLAEKINAHMGERIKTPLKQGHVWAWLNKRDGRVPAELCAAIEFVTGGMVTRYDLRPDVFGEAPVKSKKAKVA
jgi:uncharacterized membrane protein YkvA (DUF1232 family)